MFFTHIFKAYDIRGLADSELSTDLAYKIGRAYAIFLRSRGLDLDNKMVVVGRDMRETSLPYTKALIAGLSVEKAQVVDIGLATTPLFNFACTNYPAHVAGIMVTASHNPAQYNGFKMTLGDGTPVGRGNGMEEVRDLVEKLDQEDAPVIDSQYLPKTMAVLPDYLDKILTIVKPEEIKPLKIMIDAGNGMAQITFPELIKHLPIKAEFLFLEPNGNFPNHEANPLKTETLKDLQAKVLETGADFGLALDGDADRLGLVDEKGEIVDASLVGALAGLEVLRAHPGALMLYDLRSSKIVKEIWEQNGALTQQCQVGHALIKKMMKTLRAEFASELSLHLYYHTMSNVESTDLSLLYYLRLLSRTNKKLSELTAPLKKYFHSGEINFKITDKESVLRRLKEKYNDAKITNLDGLSFEYTTWWFNVRASNTEPVLRLNLEANTKEEMEKKLAEAQALILNT